MAIIDFTNPDAAAWYCAALKKLLDMGVDCFKTDFGERIPALDIAWHNGADNGRMHNFYTYLYNKTVFELLKKERGEGEAVLFARSATAACQCFPVHWGGDCSATYPSMAETLRGGLSLSLAGFGFWSHDISGFEQTAKADLFKRWTAFGLLSTHSRLHGNQSYRVPWHFDDEACDVLRFFVKLKCSLMPYLFAQAVYASTEGIPVMRPMVLEWPDDNAAAALDRQYMLGDSLLAAPVFSEDGVVSYYLPAGRWTNIIDGTVHEGGAWRTERHGYLSLPLLAAPNSIIAFGANKRRPDYDYADGITFQVFELEDGTCAAAKVFGTTGRLEIELAVTRRGAVIHVQKTGGSKPWNLLLRGIQHAKADGVTGQSCLPEGVLFAFAAGINAASIRLNG